MRFVIFLLGCSIHKSLRMAIERRGMNSEERQHIARKQASDGGFSFAELESAEGRVRFPGSRALAKVPPIFGLTDVGSITVSRMPGSIRALTNPNIHSKTARPALDIRNRLRTPTAPRSFLKVVMRDGSDEKKQQVRGSVDDRTQSSSSEFSGAPPWNAEGAPVIDKSKYVRVYRTDNAIELQTAVERLLFLNRTRTFEIDLISTVHLAEGAYYESLQSLADGRDGSEPYYDRVIFELLGETSLFESDASGARRLRADLQPAPALANQAARNQLATQVEKLDMKPDERWVLGDVSIAELQQKQEELGASFAEALAPLRSLVTSGPPDISRRDRVSLWRLLQLATLPAPELALLLDDWIAAGGVMPAPTLVAIASALSRFDLGTASRLSFAQTLASGDTTQELSRSGCLVRWRNERAVEEVDRALNGGCKRVALLYGGLHMGDLRAKLTAKYNLVGQSKKEWMTAWSISLPPQDTSLQTQANQELPLSPEMLRQYVVPALGLFALLIIDAIDWARYYFELVSLITPSSLPSELGLISDTKSAVTTVAEALFSSALYFGTHGLLYGALVRWAFEWDVRLFAVESKRIPKAAEQGSTPIEP